MNRQHAWKIVSAAALVLGVVVLLVAPASAQDSSGNTGNPRTITVTGNGTAYGTPDVGNVDVGVETSNQDFSAAFNGASDAMNKVIAALKDAGVEDKDLQTSGINVWWENPTDPQTGTPNTDVRIYHVSESLHIVVRDISKVGDVITTAVNNGANNVYNLSFGLSDTTELEGQARASAVADARARAQDLATLLGVTLGDPISVVEFPSGGSTPQPFAAADVRMAAASVPVQPGQLSVSDQVQVVFAIGQ